MKAEGKGNSPKPTDLERANTMRMYEKTKELVNLATLLRARGIGRIFVAPSKITGEPIMTIREKTGETIIELYRDEIENDKRAWIARGGREFDWYYDDLDGLANIIAVNISRGKFTKFGTI